MTNQPQDQPADPLPLEIDVTTAARHLADPAWTILDCREPAELALARLDGTLDIPMHDIPARLDELPEGRTIAVLCHHGVRSLMVARFLRTQGHTNATSILGGIEAWSTHVNPEIPRY